VYVLPAGFTGWVTVEFAVPGAPALPREEGARLLRVPADGRLATSSPQELGIIDHHYWFDDGDGSRTPIDDPAAHYGADPGVAERRHDQPVVLGLHTGTMSDAGGTHVFERFYVGTGPAGDPPES